MDIHYSTLLSTVFHISFLLPFSQHQLFKRVIIVSFQLLQKYTELQQIDMLQI